MVDAQRWGAALLVLVSLSVRAPAQPAGAVADETREVLAVTQRFASAMRARDTAVLHAVLHPNARLLGMRPAAGGGTRMQLLTSEEFIAYVVRDPRPLWTERLFDAEVRLRGTMATVWAAYDFHFGSTFSHCGMDAFQLLRTGAGWQIVSIADTYEPTGCPARPAPGGA